MTLHPRTNNTNRYPLFKEIFKDFKNRRVLDFGGNRGNLLYFSNGDIEQKNYTSIDVDLESIEHGKKEFPGASFIFNNRWNSMYNHSGDMNYVFPDIDKDQNYIFAFSVFTHTTLAELYETVKWFLTFNCEKIALSLLDINSNPFIEYFSKKRKEEYGSCVDLSRYMNDESVNILYFLDNDRVVINEEDMDNENCKHFTTFYNLNFILSYFENAGIHATIEYPNNESWPFLVIEK